jgi:hypothetical protein
MNANKKIPNLLDKIHEQLGWPSRQDIFTPKGAGPRVYAQLATEKLGRSISRMTGRGSLKVGVLSADPSSDSTQAPIALVCEFQNPVDRETIRETHRLAWNFCRTPLLVTIEPHLLRAWTCCEPPVETENLEATLEVERVEINPEDTSSLSWQAARTLHWVQLISGQFFREREKRFRREHCADQLLLRNLKSVRRKLLRKKLDSDISHDLIARMIFIQFLFDRKDSAGRPALDGDELQRLHGSGILQRPHNDLADILADHEDAYRFFRWLNEKFNGDLFPGKADSLEGQEAEWREEMSKVGTDHLRILAEFVSGRIEMEPGQYFFWRQYSFDAIPLEFISSIYEEFVGKKPGVHYTPAHIVDFLLDGVLPWDSQVWDLKIADPAAGSGIFIVKAFQRLVYRWKNAHPGNEPRADLLKRILERNLFGIDKDEHAVRVASFSLYLAMCDEIDPKHYWKQVRFPRLRGTRLIEADFFREDLPGFRTREDAHKFDLVLGNPVWGKNTLTQLASDWAVSNKWATYYHDIGPLFLAKAIALTKQDGSVAMLQPTSLINNTVSTAVEFRRKLLDEHTVEEVVNLSALRFGLFKRAIAPACIVTAKPAKPDGGQLTYICPKPTRTSEDEYRVVIEPQDVNVIPLLEARNNHELWATLMWGGARDLALVQKLGRSQSIGGLRSEHAAVTRQGIVRGDRGRQVKEIVDRHILASETFPANSFLRIRAANLPTNSDPWVHSKDSSNLVAFESPQMILKQAWLQGDGRFEAAMVEPDDKGRGALCSESFVSVHVREDWRSRLEAACLSYNSKIAVYYLLLTSGRFASYRPEPNTDDLLRVPIPESRGHPLEDIVTKEALDQRVREAFALRDSEWALVEDLFNYTLPDFKGDAGSPGRQRTRRGGSGPSGERDPELRTYCHYFLRVIRAGFGANKEISATIFQESDSEYGPVRLVGIHIGANLGEQQINLEAIDYPALLDEIQQLNQTLLSPDSQSGSVLYQRVARIYDTTRRNGLVVPTVYLLKPDQIRYWTRAMALRDADEVCADLMTWGEHSAAPQQM